MVYCGHMETNLFFITSRYYLPEMGRFILIVGKDNASIEFFNSILKKELVNHNEYLDLHLDGIIIRGFVVR